MFGKKKTEDVAELTEGKEDKIPMVLNWKEQKSLRLNGYEKKSVRYDKSFVIKNKRTGMIIELKAASAVQAANFVGWRPRHTILVKEKDIRIEKEAQGKIDDVNAQLELQKENCPALQ